MNLNDLFRSSDGLPILADLTALLRPGDSFFLVGGAVRDALLGREIHDYDFASPGDPTPVARELAWRLGGSWFWLDRERRQSRIVAAGEAGRVTLDFAPFRGSDLEADLLGRDFTINAIALPVRRDATERVIDPLRGREDLENSLLRVCSPATFDDDPLRILRGVRLALQLGFHIEERTRFDMRGCACELSRVAPERIRAEIGAILEAAPSPRGYSLLEELNLIGILFGSPESGGSFEAGIRFAKGAEGNFQALREADSSGIVDSLLRKEQEEGMSRAALHRLAAFLQGYRPAGSESAISERLRLSRQSRAILQTLADLPCERAAELRDLPSGERGQALWARSLAPRPEDALLFLPLLDARAQERIDIILRVLGAWQEVTKEGRVPDMVDGEWIRKNLGIASGPRVGELLEEVRREEIAGRVETPEDAYGFLERRAKKEG